MSSREQFYDSIAENFDEIMNKYDLERRLQVIFNRMLAKADLSGKLLLDAGCGTGHFSRRARSLGARVVSLDIGPKLLKQARAKSDILPVASDAARMPFPDGTFDVVISSEMIEHTVQPERTVGELVRVLKPGGQLVLTCPNAFWHWACALADKLKLRPYEGNENWPGWFELRRWLRAEGMSIKEMRGIHMFPFVFRPLNPLLKVLDAFGGVLGPIYVNIAIKGIRNVAANPPSGQLREGARSHGR